MTTLADILFALDGVIAPAAAGNVVGYWNLMTY